MADFFSRMAARSHGLAPTLQPVRPSRFEPVGGTEPIFTEVDVDNVAENVAENLASPKSPLPKAAQPPVPAPIQQTRPVEGPPAPEPLVRSRQAAPLQAPSLPAGDLASTRSQASPLPRHGGTEHSPAPETSPADAPTPGTRSKAAQLPKTTTTQATVPSIDTELRPFPESPTSGTLGALRSTPEIFAEKPLVKSQAASPAMGPDAPEGLQSNSQRPASRTAPVGQVETTPPSIQVTIGRIEVRAETPPTSAPASTAAPAAATPAAPSNAPLGLNEYLKQRRGGQR